MKRNSEIRTSIKKVIDKYRFFKKEPQISNIHKNRNFKSIIVFFLDQLLLLVNFMAVSWEEYSFSILPVVSRQYCITFWCNFGHRDKYSHRFLWQISTRSCCIHLCDVHIKWKSRWGVFVFPSSLWPFEFWAF